MTYTPQERSVESTLESYFRTIDRDLNKIGADATYAVSDTDFHLNDHQAYLTFSVSADPSKQAAVQQILDKYNLRLDGANDPNDADGHFHFGAGDVTDEAHVVNTADTGVAGPSAVGHTLD